MNTQKYLKKAYKKQFIKFYNREPNSTELVDFMNSWLGKNNEEKFGNSFINQDLSRKSFISQFYFVYEYEPTEEQLDMFISFMLSVVSDSGKVTEVCNVNHNEQLEDQNKQKQ